MSLPPFSDNLKPPRMLKDFLQDDTNSCNNLKPRSTFQSMVNALFKSIPFSAVKSPSHKLSSTVDQTDATVRVKDIIRWKSFRDLVDDKSQPLDQSPLRCTTTTSGSWSSRGSSWCDSDFTSEYLPDELDDGKKNLPSVGRAYEEATTETEAYKWVDPEEDVVYEEEQYSPVSVLDLEAFSEFGGSYEGEREWGLLGHSKEECVAEMDQGGWCHHDYEEQHQVCLQIENHLFASFMDDLFTDLISSP